MELNLNLWWTLASMLPVVLAITGLLFGYNTADSREENLGMIVVFTLLSGLATYWTLFILFPEWSKWWAILVLPSWFGYLIWCVLAGWKMRVHRKVARDFSRY